MRRHALAACGACLRVSARLSSRFCGSQSTSGRFRLKPGRCSFAPAWLTDSPVFALFVLRWLYVWILLALFFAWEPRACVNHGRTIQGDA
eukprot:6197904-Pleurochrysis_carterae.AAC.5